MRIGFFSDVHANLEALEACLSDFKKEKLSRIFFLGDVVGYGPDPNKCIELVDKKADVKLLGNHDAAAIGLLNTEYFNQYAQMSMSFTSQVLSEKNLKRLSLYHMEACFDIFKMVHASPKEPDTWGYILDLEDAEGNFKYFEQQACLIGHSHRPVIIKKYKTNNCEVVPHEFVKVDDDYRYIVNIGSVGQPRDGDPRSCYMIYDTDEKIMTLKRVEYEYEKTQEKMRKANLPKFLVDRIAVGK
jgi:predicted phosphodiesterase